MSTTHCQVASAPARVLERQHFPSKCSLACVASGGQGAMVSLLLQAKVVHHCVLPGKSLAADAAVKAAAAGSCLCRARRSRGAPTATAYGRARNGTEHLNTLSQSSVQLGT